MKKVIPDGSVLIPEAAEQVFAGEIFDVYQWPQTMFDNSSQTFEMLKRADTVTAICIVDNKILVIDDEQPHTAVRQCFPGGSVDKSDSSIEAAAQREVLEETGYSFNNWRLVGVRQPYHKIEWFIYVLLAWDEAGRQEPKPDVGEKITLKSVSFDELKRLTANQSSYLGNSTAIVGDAQNLDNLLALPDFEGRVVDR